MKLVVSDPKTRKAYTKQIENPASFMGKKIGEEIELGVFGLEGYTAKITGGSDKQGFPMKPDLEGTARKKIYLVKDKKQGKRIKTSKRGNMIAEDIAQINLKVIKEGKKRLAELLGGETESKEEDVSFREKAVKESLEQVGKVSAEDAKNIKGKVKG